MKHRRVSCLVSERDNTGQQSDEDVCVHAPFMSLINDYHTVSLEQEILWDKTETDKLQKHQVHIDIMNYVLQVNYWLRLCNKRSYESLNLFSFVVINQKENKKFVLQFQLSPSNWNWTLGYKFAVLVWIEGKCLFPKMMWKSGVNFATKTQDKQCYTSHHSLCLFAILYWITKWGVKIIPSESPSTKHHLSWTWSWYHWSRSLHIGSGRTPPWTHIKNLSLQSSSLSQRG